VDFEKMKRDEKDFKRKINKNFKLLRELETFG